MTSTRHRRPIPWGRVAVLSVALMELVVAVEIADMIGVGWTLATLAGLSLFGCWVIGQEGRKAWTSFTASAADGSPAGATRFWSTTATRAARRSPDTAAGLTAGLLLAIPGFITALWGGILLIPPVRQFAGRWLEAQLTRRVTSPPSAHVPVSDQPPGPPVTDQQSSTPPPTGKVVVGEIVVTDLTEPQDSEEPGPRWGPGSRPG